MASKELNQIVELIKAMPVHEDVPFEQMRVEMENMEILQTPTEGFDFSPLTADNVSAEWITPENAGKDGVILYLHGGGYCIGSINTHRAMVARIARASKTRALLIDYRLAPENPFPAAVEDATTAYRWLLGEGIPSEKIVIAGDSAGGGLTVATLLNLKDAGLSMPAAGVCISPWVDLTMSGESMKTKADVDPMVRSAGIFQMADAYLNGQDPKQPLASPLFGNLEDLPPLLIHVGTAEVLLDDSLRLSKAATSAGVDVTLEAWEDMIHVWHTFAEMLPEAGEAIDIVGKYVLQHIG
jgi:epsilon-lactone hydrolase